MNADGGFYVVKDTCITCMAPHHEAPELMGMDDATGCYFRRQPQTAEELYAAHTKKWILTLTEHRACHHSTYTRTAQES